MKKFIHSVHTLSLDGVIEVTGQVPHKKVVEYMKNANFVILPSWNEGLGIVLLEAMACSLPVIASKIGGIPEIINEKVGVLVNPKNPNELAKAIKYTISKTWNREYISEYAKAYTWEKNVEKTIKVYEEILCQ